MDVEMGTTEVERGLSRYVVATRKTFEGQRSLSMTLDASRVGNKNIFVGVIARPDNVAAIIPPQVGLAGVRLPNARARV